MKQEESEARAGEILYGLSKLGLSDSPEEFLTEKLLEIRKEIISECAEVADDWVGDPYIGAMANAIRALGERNP